MVKPEWGTKRMCLSCGAKFYDLLKEPIICPKCETEFEPAASKPRRSRVQAARPAAAPKAASPATEDDDSDLLADDDDDDDAEVEGVIEDTSDLEGGDDAMADVPVAVEDDKEDT